MEEEQADLFSEIRDLVAASRTSDAVARLGGLHPADQADVIAELDDAARSALLPAIPRPDLARAIEYLPDQSRSSIIEEIPTADLAPLLDEVDDDITVDILHELGEERAGEVLREMKRAWAVSPLLGHSDETAGGHMTGAFIRLNGNWTVERTITYLRRVRPEADSAYYLYVVDGQGRLEGVVSLRDLIIAPPDAALSDIMLRDVRKVRDDMDQEEMARFVQRYDLVALPVVDANDRLVGVITVDDVLDIVEEEATEDILKLAGIGVKEHALSPIMDSARRRLPWLLVNMAVGLCSALIVTRFENTISKVAVLAALMPIIAGQGGNASIQTATIVVRGLALDEIDVGDLVRVLLKELMLGAVKGLLFGSVLAVVALAWSGNGTLAGVAAAAMFLNMLVASLGGVLIPMTLRYGLKVDPATAAGVFDTMLTDIMGFFIFLGLATIMLDRLT
ncbi:MAG: magnesium transporter [Chloroflexi bacterium]|nr:magnesium transporter [Chloroflexota bacterium]